jgi:flavin-dependent dehydrogenase
MRGAVLQLDRWGVLPEIVAGGTPAIRSTTFCYAESDTTVPIEPKYGVSALYAPRRTLLDRVLADAAFKSGVDIRYGVRVDGVKVDSRGRVVAISAVEGGKRRDLEADMIIGADGLHSTIARQVGAPQIAGGRHATGVLYGYWEGLSADEYRWWFKPGVSMGSIPTNDGATCVFVSVPATQFRHHVRGNAATAYTRLIRQISPLFAERLADSVRVEPVRGFAGHRGFIRRGSGPGWALVGDAGYFKDPSTAHGITDAFRDAELLARAVMRGTSAAFAEYEATRFDLSRMLFQVTDEIASLDMDRHRSAVTASRLQRRNVAGAAGACHAAAHGAVRDLDASGVLTVSAHVAAQDLRDIAKVTAQHAELVGGLHDVLRGSQPRRSAEKFEALVVEPIHHVRYWDRRRILDVAVSDALGNARPVPVALGDEESFASTSAGSLHERERFERHSLRLATNGPNGLEIPATDVVIDRPAADLQDLGGSVDGNSFHGSHISGKSRTPAGDARTSSGCPTAQIL